jgi:hypothetical protein
MLARVRASSVAISLWVLGCTRPTEPLVIAPVPVADDEAAAAAACERAWMATWAQGQGLRVGECRRLALDDDAAREPVMQACSEDGHRAVYLVDDAQGRWAIEHDGWGHVPVCSPAAFSAGGSGLVLVDTGPGDQQERRVALRDGRPVIVGVERASAREAASTVREVWDFDRARLHREVTAAPAGCERPGLDVDAAVLVVRGDEITAEWVVDGASSHHGADDGQLRARARATRAGSIRVEVETRDDERIAAPAATRAREPADAVVLRWASASAAIDPLGCEGGGITELWVTAVAEGPPRVSGSGAAAAVVQGDLDELMIALDPRALGIEAVPWQLPFSLELVDVDRDGATSLATSRWVADRPGSLGAMVRHPDDRRHPPIGIRVDPPSAAKPAP